MVNRVRDALFCVRDSKSGKTICEFGIYFYENMDFLFVYLVLPGILWEAIIYLKGATDSQIKF